MSSGWSRAQRRRGGSRRRGRPTGLVEHDGAAVHADDVEVEGGVAATEVPGDPSGAAADVEDFGARAKARVEPREGHETPQGRLAQADEPVEEVVGWGDAIEHVRHERELGVALQPEPSAGACASKEEGRAPSWTVRDAVVRRRGQ